MTGTGNFIGTQTFLNLIFPVLVGLPVSFVLRKGGVKFFFLVEYRHKTLFLDIQKGLPD